MLCKFTLAARDIGILNPLADLSVTAISHAARDCLISNHGSATNDVKHPRPNSEMSISTHFEGQKYRA